MGPFSIGVEVQETLMEIPLISTSIPKQFRVGRSEHLFVLYLFLSLSESVEKCE